MSTSQVDYVRLDSDKLSHVAVGYDNRGPWLSIQGSVYVPSDFELVWFRRPRAIEVEECSDRAEAIHLSAEWSEALEGFLAHIPFELWINHPSRNALASHKLEQLSRARAAGLIIPETVLTQDSRALNEFWHSQKGAIVTKPLASGFLQRSNGAADTVIYTSAVGRHHLQASDALARCPTLFQEQIEKSFDVRVCIVDGEVVSTGLRRVDAEGRQILDIRRDNMQEVEYFESQPPEAVRQALVQLVHSYGLRFAAIDMAVDRRDRWVFFEINPNGQWAWLDLAGGADVGGLFLWAMKAKARQNH